MWVDPTRIRQVVLNLLTNACRFTEAGSVHVSAVREGDQVRVAVADTGIGISPEDQQRIFAPFVQADASTTRNFGGSGLGLTIVSKLVEFMGGENLGRERAGKGHRVPLHGAAGSASGRE